MKKRRDSKVVTRRTNCEGQRLVVVDVRYVAIPDAESRLSRAIDILLRSAATGREGSVSAKKEEEPPKDSRLEKIAGQRDGEKG